MSPVTALPSNPAYPSSPAHAAVPYMGLLRMLEGIPVGNSDFGKQIEYMYVNGNDFRQFIVTSIPMTVMEVLMRVFYVAKQVSLGKGAFGEILLDTMPLRLNPRFRMMLALGYGTIQLSAGAIRHSGSRLPVILTLQLSSRAS